MPLKPVDKLSFSELRDEYIRLSKKLSKPSDTRATIAMMKTAIRKWRTEEEQLGDSVPEPVIKMPAPKTKEPLISKAPVKEKKNAAKAVKVTKGNKQQTIRPMGASGSLSAEIIRMHEEGMSVVEIQASDPEKFKYNTVFMIIKRYKIRQKKVDDLIKQSNEE